LPQGLRLTFAGSDEGGRRGAAIYTLIETCKLDDVDPQAWLADVLARLRRRPPQSRFSPATPRVTSRARRSSSTAAGPQSTGRPLG
jgi:transposase